jgi:putative oxidoreductase
VRAGRFEWIGFENFEFPACFVATFEILCGILLIVGFVVCMLSLPLLIIMFTAVVSTKIPILMADGLWVISHAARTDFAMTQYFCAFILAALVRVSK